jgi:glycosyltransferase involved in cell wall biosynthesis
MERLRILATVEPHSLAGSAKAVLEFAKEATCHHPDVPQVDLSVLTFNRGQDETHVTRLFRDMAIPVDVIHERGQFDTNVISLLRAVCEKRHPDVVWSNSVKSHFLVRFACMSRSLKWVAFHHGYTTTDMKMRAYNLLDRWSLAKANRVLTSSGAFVGELVRKNVRLDNIRVQHMPIRPFAPVAEEEKSELRRRIGCTAQTRILLSVGRLSCEKGHIDLIRSFSKIRELVGDLPLQLVLVGEGPERSRIEKLCRGLHLSDVVTLAGQQNSIDPYYAIADVFLLPSLSEGCPNVVLEAMAAGVPVVARAVGGVPEIATNGRNAILVKKHDEAGLASAAAELLRNRELRDRLVSCAHEIVSVKTPESYFRSITSVFRQVCADDH